MRLSKTAFSLCVALVTLVLTACGSSGSASQNGSPAFSQASNPMPHIAALSQTQNVLFAPSDDRSAPAAGVPAIINGWVSLSRVQKVYHGRRTSFLDKGEYIRKRVW